MSEERLWLKEPKASLISLPTLGFLVENPDGRGKCRALHIYCGWGKRMLLGSAADVFLSQFLIGARNGLLAGSFCTCGLIFRARLFVIEYLFGGIKLTTSSIYLDHSIRANVLSFVRYDHPLQILWTAFLVRMNMFGDNIFDQSIVKLNNFFRSDTQSICLYASEFGARWRVSIGALLLHVMVRLMKILQSLYP